MSMYSHNFPIFQQILWSVHCKIGSFSQDSVWFTVVCYNLLWFIIGDPSASISDRRGCLFGACDLGRWTPGWTLRVGRNFIQDPNSKWSSVDDIIHFSSFLDVEYGSIFSSNIQWKIYDIIHFSISSCNPWIVLIATWQTHRTGEIDVAQALDNRRNQASQSCCAWAPVRRFGRWMRNK